MATEDEISWPYTDKAVCLGIRLKTDDGTEYPLESDNEKIVKIDTGYEGEILLPNHIYDELGLNRWEEPDRVEYAQGDGSPVSFKVARAGILIPKLSNNPLLVKIHAFASGDIDEILIGIKFIKKLKLLLDGPDEKCVCYNSSLFSSD